MRGYDRHMYRADELDDYEEDGEELEEEVEEEYEEEQEDHKPTEEELKYLEMRQKLKEAVRKRMKKENDIFAGSSQEKKRKLPHDNYGSFFGPSQPVIAQRVIQESKSLLENQHLAARISNSTNDSKKNPTPTNFVTRPGVREPPPKVNHEMQAKLKAQKLKDNRDYSFLLSEDSELPAPKKGHSPPNGSIRNSDARSAQVQPNSRPSMSSHSKNGRDERKSVSANRQLSSKAAHHQVASGSRQPYATSVDSRKQLGINSGNGPGLPMGQKGLPSKMPVLTKPPMSNKSSSMTMDRKPSLNGTKKPAAGIQRAPAFKLHSIAQKQQSEQRRDVRDPVKGKMDSKMSVASSKPQKIIQNKPAKQIQAHAPMRVDRPNRRPAGPYFDDEEEDPMTAIRNMFGYDPSKYRGVDESDSDMEANFEDIQREEKRSLRIAKEEDERELRLIEEEERQERLRKEAKRRKLSQR